MIPELTTNAMLLYATMMQEGITKDQIKFRLLVLGFDQKKYDDAVKELEQEGLMFRKEKL